MATMPSPLRALIVDAEAPALTELVRLLGQDARIGAVRTAGNRAQALQALERESIDVLFCDTSTPGLDGPHLARALARFDRRPHLVFITGQAADHRQPGGGLPAAVDYVRKPIRPDRLAEAIRRAIDRAVEASQDETIAVELGGITRFVRRSDVLYVEAQGDYARLHTAGGSHLIRIPLTTLAEQWAPAGFLRVHRSTLVALPHVEEVVLSEGRFQLRLAGGRTVQVSRRQGRALRDRLTRGTSAAGTNGRPGPRLDPADDDPARHTEDAQIEPDGLIEQQDGLIEQDGLIDADSRIDAVGSDRRGPI